MLKYCHFSENRRNLRLIVKIWTFLRAIFQMKIFVCLKFAIILLKTSKLRYILPYMSKINFLGDDNFFKCEIFFFMNTLLICRKLAKFATNFWNMNFSSGWNFQMWDFFFLQICCSFVINWQNGRKVCVSDTEFCEESVFLIFNFVKCPKMDSIPPSPP